MNTLQVLSQSLGVRRKELESTPLSRWRDFMDFMDGPRAAGEELWYPTPSNCSVLIGVRERGIERFTPTAPASQKNRSQPNAKKSHSSNECFFNEPALRIHHLMIASCRSAFGQFANTATDLSQRGAKSCETGLSETVFLWLWKTFTSNRVL